MVIYLIFHLIMATLSVSIMKANFEDQFNGCKHDDLGFFWLISLLFGPISIVVSFFMSGFCRSGFSNPFVVIK